MKKYRKYLTKVLTILAVAISAVSFFVIMEHYKNADEYICNEVPDLLYEAIKKDVEFKTKHVFYTDGPYTNNPYATKDKYETSTFESEDTTFTYRSRIVDRETNLFRGLQTYLLLTNRLHPDDTLQILFDSLSLDKGIKAHSAIGITASFYKKLNEWSSDTTAMSVDYRTSVLNQGIFEDINYHAYIDCSFLTFWNLMPKTGICMLFALLLLNGIVLVIWMRRTKREKNGGIIALKDGNYQIRGVLIDVAEKKIVTDEKETDLTLQQYKLLLLFLQAEHNRVEKRVIKEIFWPKHANPDTNMTTAIVRLKKTLAEADIPYTIVADKKNPEYCFQYTDTGQSSDTDVFLAV